MAKPISDAAIKKATGKNWAAWKSFLNKQDGKNASHKGLVAILKEAGVAPWWQQAISGQYEKEVQGRKMHEMPEGFQATASKTINTSAKKIYDSFELGKASWIPDGSLKISTSTSPTTIRGAWDGKAKGRVDIYITEKTSDKCQVAINHTKINDAKTCEERKTAWRAALTLLKKDMEI